MLPPIEYPPHDGVRFIRNIRIPMSDGISLSMDIHVPDSGDWQTAPRPLAFNYVPYRKDDQAPYTGTQHVLAKNGYIGARIDCRGSGSSEGVTTDEYSEREQQDGFEAIEWIASQPWSTGRVAMFGTSYGGFTSVQVAARQPPHLSAIIPTYFTDDRYTDDCHYRGGAMRCYYDIGSYGASMIGMNAMPPYPQHVGEDWARIWEEHLENNEPYILTWLANQTDSDYWRPGSIRGRYDQIICPVFMIGGWRDGYPNPPLRTFRNLKAPKKLLIGPWNHSSPDSAIPGPRIDIHHEMIRWLDRWLKDEENGVENDPPVCVYMQRHDRPDPRRLDTSGYWRTERRFPVSRTNRTELYLSDEGALASRKPRYKSRIDTYDYDPTVGLQGGLWSGGVPFGLPADQRPDEIHARTYTSLPLDEPLEIVGWPKATLYASSSAPVMVFVVRLCDVAPDGSSALICSGVLNGTRRKSLTDPEPMEPGRVYRLDIDLDGTAWRFDKGHRIRLAVSSADFPNLWPTPTPGTNSIHRGVRLLSRLTLPVVPTKEPEDETTFGSGSEGSLYGSASPDKPAWEIVNDVLGERVGMRMSLKGKGSPEEGRVIENEADLELWVSQNDPAHVSAVGRHHRAITTTDGPVTVTSTYGIRSTADAFHATIDLNVTVNGLLHHQRRWVRSFPRQLL